MTADAGHRPRRSSEAVLVVTLGKSKGASTVAAGLAVAQAEAARRVLLAELDPGGGDLIERLVFDGQLMVGRAVDVPAGARELAGDLEAAELASAGGPVSERRLGSYVVPVDGVGSLIVLLGDPLVDGARHSVSVVGPRIGLLAAQAGLDAVIVDGGRWTSSEPDRLVGVGLVYAVVEASSTSQNHRCLAEMQSLWRQLRAANPRARMVVTIVRPAWPARQLIDLYSNPPGADAAQIDSGYRVVVLDLDRSGRQAASRLAAGRWNGISAKGMRAFVELARPIGAARREADPGRLEPARVDEYAYLDAAAGQVKVSPPPVAWPFTDAEIQWADDQKTPPGDRDTDDGPGGDPATPPGPRSTGGDGS